MIQQYLYNLVCQVCNDVIIAVSDLSEQSGNKADNAIGLATSC